MRKRLMTNAISRFLFYLAHKDNHHDLDLRGAACKFTARLRGL